MSIIDELRVKMECKAQVVVLERKRKRLENKLKEIKNIVETLLPLTNEYDNCYYKEHCKICHKQMECQYRLVEKILEILESR